MKDAFYFSHDSNASNDPKIIQMCSVYGAEGYGWYWMLIEMMREQHEYKIDISGKYAINSLAVRMYTNKDTLESFLDDCVNEFKLFVKEDGFIWSNSLLRRMAEKDAKSQKARESVMKRWAKKPVNTPPDTNVSQTDTIKESKEKESKRKEKDKRDMDDNAREAEAVDNSVQQVNFTLVRKLENKHGPLSQIEINCVTEWQASFADEIVEECFSRYKDRGGSGRSYMDTIFVNWKKAGVQSIEDVKGQDALFEQQRTKSFTPRGKPADSVSSVMAAALGG